MWKNMDQLEKELMNVFNCNPEWPICLFDFSYKNKIPNYFSFKIDQDFNERIIENYFDNPDYLSC